MSFEAANDRIVIRDGSKIVFDTRRKMPLITQVFAGTLTMPRRDSTISASYTHTIGPVIGNPEFVLPVAKVTYADTWPNINISLAGTLHTTYGSYYDTLIASRLFTFMVQSGNLILRERIYLLYPDIWSDASTFEYKVYLGRYT